MTSSPRIAPLPTAEWSAEAHEAFAVMASSATRDLGSSSNLVMTLANHPQLAKAYYAFGRHLLLASTLSHRHREIVTLRVAWRYKAEYEWYHHVRLGKRVGRLTDEEIEAIKLDVEAGIWTETDRCVLRVTDQLCARSAIDDATWDELSRFLSRHQTMDLVFTIGHYVMVAWAMSAFGIEVEPGYRNSDHALT